MSDKRLFFTALALIVVLGGALRLYDLGAESYWSDEISSIQRAREGFDAIPGEIEGKRNPAFVILTHFWIEIAGTGEAQTRLLAALSGIAALGVIAMLGSTLFDRRVGLLSALLLGVSEYQIYYAQDFRCYSLMLLTGLLSYLGYVRALRDNHPRDFALYVIASALLFYTHAFGILLIAAQVLAFVPFWGDRTRRARWLLAQAALLVIISPSLALHAYETLSGQQEDVTSWMPVPSIVSPVRTLYKMLFPGRHLPALLVLAAGAAVALVGTGVWWVRHGRVDGRRVLVADFSRVINPRVLGSRWAVVWLVGLWLVVPVAILLAMSVVFDPVYHDRYLIGSAPALYLLAALVMAGVRRIVPVAVSVAVLLIVIAPGLHEYYVEDVNDQWREVAAQLEGQGEPGDVIVFAPTEAGVFDRNLRWYYRGSLPMCDIDPELSDPADIQAALDLCTEHYTRFWVVIRGEGDYLQPFVTFFSDQTAPDRQLRDTVEFVGITVALFEHLPPRAEVQNGYPD